MRRGSRASRTSADLVLNARIDVHLRGGATAEALERARAYRAAGADCVYPIGVADEATIAAFVELGMPVNILLGPGAPPVERLAELGVARISLGHHLHAATMAALARRLGELSPRAASRGRRS